MKLNPIPAFLILGLILSASSCKRNETVITPEPNADSLRITGVYVGVIYTSRTHLSVSDDTTYSDHLKVYWLSPDSIMVGGMAMKMHVSEKSIGGSYSNSSGYGMFSYNKETDSVSYSDMYTDGFWVNSGHFKGKKP